MLIIDAWFFLRWWYLFYFRDWRNKHSWIETWECIWCSRTNIFPWKFYFMYAIYAFVNVYLYWVKTENAFLNLMLCYAKSLQSCLTLCDPIDGSHQAPLSLGLSRQEHWSGVPLPSPSTLSKIRLFMIQFSLRERDIFKYLNTIALPLNSGASKKDFCLWIPKYYPSI